jgi:DNA-binding transcriptional LysR family regulator
VELENRLDVALFLRRQGRLLPTAEAHWLFNEAEEALARLDRLDNQMRGIRHMQPSQLRLVTTPPVADGLLCGALRNFRLAYPDTSVSVHIAVLREARNWTAAQQFDIAVTTLPINYPVKDVVQLVHVPGVCIMPRDHELASAPMVHALDLQGHDLVMLLPETWTRLRLDSLFERVGLVPRVAIQTQTSSSVCIFVAAGTGVGLVDPFTAYRFRNQGLEIRPFEPSFNYEYGLLYPTRRESTQVAEAFAPMVRDIITSILTWYVTNFPEYEWPHVSQST